MCKTCEHYRTQIIDDEWVRIGCGLEYNPYYNRYCRYYRMSYEYRYKMLEEEGKCPMEILDIMYEEGYG